MSSPQLLPWKVAFRVEFRTPKLGLKFHPSSHPNTGNGMYCVSLLDIPYHENPNTWGPAQQYNAGLRPEQEHLKLKAGLYLTHINNDHIINVPPEVVISKLKAVGRPVKLRFVDVDAGTVSLEEIQMLKQRASYSSSIPIPNEKEQTLMKHQSMPYPSSSIDGGEVRSCSPTTSSIPSSKSSLSSISKNEEKQTLSSSIQTISQQNATDHSNFVKQSDDIYKIVLLGSAGVGKSSILSVGIDGNDGFLDRRPTTLQPEFGSLYVPNPDISNPNQVIKVRIWDTAGQERYRAITRSHYRRADGAMLVYDVSDPRSFEALDEWLQDLRESAGDSIKSIILVENKVDQLPLSTTNSSMKANRPRHFVNEHRVAEYCKANGLLFARTSAKMNGNAHQWEGQKISDVINQLVLNVHATKLSRGMANQSNPISANESKETLGNESENPSTIQLNNDLLKDSTDKKTVDCASCN